MKIPDDFPQTQSSIWIGQAVERMKKMPREERIQLMVKANLLTQEEADRAIKRLTTAGTMDSPRPAESVVAGS